MARRSVTVPDELDERLPYGEHESKSATIVHYVQEGLDAEELREQLTEALERADEAEAEADQLQADLVEARARADRAEERV
ncbi:hypothetical protein ACFQE1_12015, partial [Halobium palmae]